MIRELKVRGENWKATSPHGGNCSRGYGREGKTDLGQWGKKRGRQKRRIAHTFSCMSSRGEHENAEQSKRNIENGIRKREQIDLNVHARNAGDASSR